MIRKETIYIYFSLILYRLSLDFIYLTVVSPLFSYATFVDEKTKSQFFVSWIMLLLLFPLILKDFRKHTFSSNVVLLLFLLSYIPTTSLIAFIPYNTDFIILSFLYWFIFLFINRWTPSFSIKIYKSTKYPNLFFWLILLVLCFTVLYISGTYTHFRFHFNLTDIYDFRMAEREFGLPIVLDYLSSAANFLIPLYLVYFLNIKNKILVFLLSVVILLNFGIGGHKAVLFMFILSFLGYWFYRLKWIKHFAFVFVGLTLMGYLQYVFFDDFTIVSLFNYRLLFIPAQINYFFYDFFLTHELDFFRQGILRWFGFESPYKESLNFIIGGEYMGNDTIRANNGLFTDAYMNLGAIGVIIFPLILIIIIRIIDACASGLSEKFVFLPIMITVIVLLSTTFTTALLSGGLVIMMFTLYFLPRNNNSAKAEMS